MNCHNALERIQELNRLGRTIVVVNKVNQRCGEDGLIEDTPLNNTILDTYEVLRIGVTLVLVFVKLTVGHIQVEGRKEHTYNLLARPLRTLLVIRRRRQLARPAGCLNEHIHDFTLVQQNIVTHKTVNTHECVLYYTDDGLGITGTYNLKRNRSNFAQFHGSLFRLRCV